MGADRPGYDAFSPMEVTRAPSARAFAHQILTTSAPWLRKPEAELDVLDIGSGYGHTARELARTCRSVEAIEPAADLAERATALHKDVANLRLRRSDVLDLDVRDAFDLVVLDNVYEHLPRQQASLAAIVDALRPGGVLFLLTPNKLWPIEAHYRLPFLSYLPLSMANRYLRASGRGTDYKDASYAPTARSLARALDATGQLDWQFVLPAAATATMAGAPWHYRLGMAVLEHRPELWAISKALLVIAVKGAA
ncbi:MAG: class I SAM-dependent methyltransferase [Actinomycetota bacterium]|nr:class I SAM-dependent methyltransferase [Actinomycetota bacterium]